MKSFCVLRFLASEQNIRRQEHARLWRATLPLPSPAPCWLIADRALPGISEAAFVIGDMVQQSLNDHSPPVQAKPLLSQEFIQKLDSISPLPP